MASLLLQRIRLSPGGRLGSGLSRAPSVAGPAAGVLAAGVVLLAVGGSVVVLQTLQTRHGVVPAFFAAAALAPLVMFRPAWIVPVFLAFTWTAIGRASLGGLSPVNYGSYILLPMGAYFAWTSRRQIAGQVLAVLGLISLALIATGLLASNGAGVSSESFKDIAFLVIAALCVRSGDMDRVVIALVLVGIFLSLGGVYSVRAHPTSLFPLDSGPPGTPSALAPGEAPRAAGPIGDSNFFALSLAALVPFALYLISRRGWRLRLGVLGLLSLIAGIYSTGSRGGAAAAGAVILVVAAAGGDRRMRLGALVAVAGGALMLLLFSAQANDSSHRTVAGRATENLIAVHMFEDHPLAGVGPGQYPFYYRDYARKYGNDPRSGREPHSLPLQIAAEEGMVGILAWLGAGIILVRFALTRRLWQDPLGRTVLLATLTYVIGSLFLHGSQLRLLWILVGLAFAMGGEVQRRPRPSRRS